VKKEDYMNERQWERLGAATGILFVVLLVISAFGTPTPPDLNDQPVKFAQWFRDHQDGIRTATFIGMIAGFLFLWFLGSLRSFLRAAEGGTGRLSSVAFAGGIATVALATVGSTCLTVGALRPTTTPFILQMLADVNFYVLAVGGFTIAAYLAAGSMVILRSGALPAWLGGLGVLGAIAQLLTEIAIFGSKTGPFNPKDGVVVFIGFIAFLLWTLITSILMTGRVGAAGAVRSAEISS
jgi:hypothetical protein